MNNVLYSCDPRIVLVVENYLDKKIPKSILCGINTSAKNDPIVFYEDLLNPIRKSAYIFLTNYYVYYQCNNEYYIDINHIIATVTDNEIEHIRIYQKYKQYIKTSIWDIRYDNFISKRELIDVDTFYSIVLSSNNEFSQIYYFEYVFYVILLLLYLYQTKKQIKMC